MTYLNKKFVFFKNKLLLRFACSTVMGLDDRETSQDHSSSAELISKLWSLVLLMPLPGEPTPISNVCGNSVCKN